MAVHDSAFRCVPALVFALVAAACSKPAPGPEPLTRQLGDEEFVELTMAWRKRRVERLTEPYGWLSLTGLHRLQPGANTVGTAASNDIVVNRGPEQWGRVVVDDQSQSARFEVASIDQVRINGETVRETELTVDGDHGPTRIEAQGIRMHLVVSGDVLAMRVRDPQAAPRQSFAGIDYYQPDPAWRLAARFVEHPPGSSLQIVNVMGQLIDEPNPGRAEFEVDGEKFSLEAILSDDRLFFIFADRTSGRETYGLGRFVYADLPVDGQVVLDFNQAYNPPCAFNEFTTCPLPPSANRIPIPIRAGEQKYSGTPGLTSTSSAWSGPE